MTDLTEKEHSRNQPLSGSSPNEKSSAWSIVYPLIKRQFARLSFGVALLITNRLSGLVLPYSMKYLFDKIIGQREMRLLLPFIVVVSVTTIVQACTSRGLTQLLTKGAHKLIAEMRQTIYAHIIKLPLSFYDSNKIGIL